MHYACNCDRQSILNTLSNRIQESGVRIQQCFLYDWQIARRIPFGMLRLERVRVPLQGSKLRF
ncbi:hypothetical protein [Nostoc commune]|uniref:hypothetical protein n=1 Tax=Nostoc commune TaxID=1178 RepID=UPI002073F07B|nr:hypothetical protein [Nostoc commune]